MDRRDFMMSAAAWAATGSAASTPAEWRYYAGDQGATRYSPVHQITPANVSGLSVAWVHHSARPGSRYKGSVECTRW